VQDISFLIEDCDENNLVPAPDKEKEDTIVKVDDMKTVNDRPSSNPKTEYLLPANRKEDAGKMPIGVQRSFDSIESDVVTRDNALQVIGVTRGNSIFNDMPDNIYDDMPEDTFRDIPDYVFEEKND
jgi:hypothetical protein